MQLRSTPTWIFWLNVVSALAALAAAVFWSMSASPLPPMKTYWGGAPAGDPFFAALQESAKLSGRAAVCAAVSAACFGTATLLERLTVVTVLRSR